MNYLGILVLGLTAITDFSTTTIDSVAYCFQTRVANYHHFLDQNFDDSESSPSPLAQIFVASKANNEVYTLKEMLLQSDKEMFIKAMEDEVSSMFEHDIWGAVPKRNMFEHYNKIRSDGTQIKRQKIMMIWSFKRKRHPDGSLSKHKARLCCHGGQQQWGLNFWETYAPVVAWSSIRILLTLAKNQQTTHKVSRLCSDVSSSACQINNLPPNTSWSHTPIPRKRRNSPETEAEPLRLKGCRQNVVPTFVGRVG